MKKKQEQKEKNKYTEMRKKKFVDVKFFSIVNCYIAHW